MNNTFSIQRFGLLLKRQWLEFGKIYLISLAVILGIFLVFYGFNYYQITTFVERGISLRSTNFREPLFIIMGLIFISIIASSYFAHLGQKSRAIIDLMIPASTFEKFMAGIFFTSVLAVFSYLAIFLLTDMAFMIKLRGWSEATGQGLFIDGSKVEAESMFQYFFTKNNPNQFLPLYAMPFLLISVFLLGSIYFEKFHYIKTAICVMIFSGIWTAIIVKSGKILFDGRIPVKIDQPRHFMSEKATAEVWLLFLFVILTLVFWCITYVRLKEKEV